MRMSRALVNLPGLKTIMKKVRLYAHPKIHQIHLLQQSKYFFRGAISDAQSAAGPFLVPQSRHPHTPGTAWDRNASTDKKIGELKLSGLLSHGEAKKLRTFFNPEGTT